jgi:hypothetical protein
MSQQKEWTVGVTGGEARRADSTHKRAVQVSAPAQLVQYRKGCSSRMNSLFWRDALTHSHIGMYCSVHGKSEHHFGQQE